jgi:hypothetical protein
VDDADLEQQREAYKVEGVDESEPAAAHQKKRKGQPANGDEVRHNLSFLQFELDELGWDSGSLNLVGEWSRQTQESSSQHRSLRDFNPP